MCNYRVGICWLSFLLRIDQIFLVLCISNNLGLYLGHFEYYVTLGHIKIFWGVFIFSLFLFFFFLVGSQSGWSQALSHSLSSGSNVSSVLKTFAIIFGSLLNMHHSVISLGAGQFFTSQFRSHGFLRAVPWMHNLGQHWDSQWFITN